MDETEGTSRAEDVGPIPDEDSKHDCQPPRDDPPAVGGEWQCPTCGTWWRLEDAIDHPENLPERRDQQVNWVRVGKHQH